MARTQKVDATNFKSAFVGWSAAEKEKLTPGLLSMLKSDADLAKEVDDAIVILGLRKTRKKITELGMTIKESDLTDWHKTVNPDHYKEPEPKAGSVAKAAEAAAPAPAPVTEEIASSNDENDEAVSGDEGDPVEPEEAAGEIDSLDADQEGEPSHEPEQKNRLFGFGRN